MSLNNRQQHELSSVFEGVSLSNICEILVRHKTLFCAVVSICVLVGLGLAWVRPPVYHFSQAIMPASRLQQAGRTLLEPIDSVASRIQMLYIPEAIGEYNAKHSGKGVASYDAIKVVRTQEGNIVGNRAGLLILDSIVPLQNRQRQVTLYQMVLNLVKKDEQSVVDARYVNSKYQISVLKSQLLLQEKIRNALFSSLRGISSVNSSKRPKQTLTQTHPLLVADTASVETLRVLLGQQLFVTAMQQPISKIKERIFDLQQEQKSVRAAQFENVLTRSLTPVGVSRFVIVAMSFLLGLIIALLVAVFVDTKTMKA